MAIELQNHQVKVSFRSRTEAVDVSQVSEQFKGGGHRQAAGATLAGPFADAITRALDAMKTAVVSARTAAPVTDDS